MRNGFIATMMLMSTAGIASAQQVVVATQKIADPAQTQEARVTADDVIARLMFFDRNHDGKVAVAELSERMQPLVGRGDRGGDGALEAAEIRALAASSIAEAAANLALSGRYAFGDTVGQTSRMHIQNTIEDLRLVAPETTLQAKRIGAAFADEMDAAAHVRLREALTPLFTADELTRFDANRTRLATAEVLVTRTSNGSETRTFVITGEPTAVLARQLQPEEIKVAEAAVEAFKAETRLDDARRSALVARLSGVLNEEDCDNVSAALTRRPLVKSRGSLLTAGASAAFLEAMVQSLQSLPSQVSAAGR